MKKLFNLQIGVDIENIGRFKLDRIKNKIFLERIFSKQELKYCFSKHDPAPHLAARFSAKEAIVKAVNGFGKKPPALNKISVENTTKGAPLVVLRGYDVKISLSHCGDKAIAFVLLRKK